MQRQSCSCELLNLCEFMRFNEVTMDYVTEYLVFRLFFKL